MQPKRSITIAALIGTITEYYDYSLYGFSSLAIAKAFFPGDNLIDKTTMALAVFAIGYLSKPLGSIVFGYLGDRYGRKVSLRITMLGICLPTMAIALVPGYEILGASAPILVIACRFLQGIFAGGEYDGAAIYMLEHSGKVQSGHASAVIRAAAASGLLLGAICISVFDMISPDLWRVPFLLSIPLMIATFILRNRLEETPEYLAYLKKRESRQETTDEAGFVALFRNSWKKILFAVILFGSFSACMQFSLVFMKTYMEFLALYSKHHIHILHIAVLALTTVSMILTSIYVERIGARRLISSCFATAVAIIAGLVAAIYFEVNSLIAVFHLAFAFVVAPTNALMHGYIYEIFAVHERYKGMSLSHTFGSMLLSGTSPVIAFSLYRITKINVIPFIYPFLMVVLAWGVSLRLNKIMAR